MSWQDELERLDQELASGQVSPANYRQRREQVLAEAAGEGPPPPALPRQPWFGPPPPRQPLRQSGTGETEERTQIVHRDWSAASDSEGTELVRPVGGPGTPPPGFPHPQGVAAPSPWPPMPGQPGGATLPPWGRGRDELPRDYGGAPREWQGPEVFDDAGRGSGKRVALIVAIVVLVLGGVVGAFFAISGSHPQAASSSTNQAATTTVAAGPTLPAGPFVSLPGKLILNSTQPIAAAATAGQPISDEAQLLQRNGVAEVSGLVAEDNGIREGIWVFKPDANIDPKAVLAAIDNLHSQFGWQQLSNAPQGVTARSLTNSQTTSFRAHYVTAGVVVQVEVYPGTSAASLNSDISRNFQVLLNEETNKYPPTS